MTGSESLLADRAVDTVIHSALREESGTEVERVSGEELDGNRFSELAGGSLFANHTVLVINDVSKAPADLFDVIVATAMDPGQQLAFVVRHPGGNQGRKLLDRLKKSGAEVITATPIKTWELPQFVRNEARHHRVNLDQDAAEALVAALGSDLRALSSAVEQLGSDVEGQVTVAAVQQYFAGRSEVTSFAVADAVMAGDANRAVEQLRWAIDTGVPPVLVTSAMAGSLRALGKYLDVRGARLRDAEVAREVGVPPWKVKDLNRQSRAWSPRAIAHSLRAVRDADAAVKGASVDHGFALEKMIMTVLGLRNAG